MRDYLIHGMPISEAPTHIIQEAISEGFVVRGDDGHPDQRERLLERLRIEIVVRGLEGRL